MTMAVQTAAEALERYSLFLAEGRLLQSAWHKEVDGRQLACGLGVLGDAVNDPSQCPANIMPRWLAQMVPWFFDNQKPDDAFAWGAKFYAELKRIDGKVPFSVVHDWQANVVGPLAIEVAELRTRPVEPHQAKIDLHKRALAGDLAKVEEWREKLRPAYANAYANADAYADAYADADAKAIKRLADGMVECLARVPADAS